MCAGRPSRVFDVEPLVPSSLPICWRNLPSAVNFRIWSPSLLPPSQTLPSRSTWMPCSFFIQAGPGPGRPRRRAGCPRGRTPAPAAPRCSTWSRGGLACAPFSSSSSVAGRWMIQMLSWPSTAMPATWPRIQFAGQRLRPERLGLEFRRGLLGCGQRGARQRPPAATASSNRPDTHGRMPGKSGTAGLRRV